MKKDAEAVKEGEEKTIPTFTKAALIKSKRFDEYRDVLTAILEDGKEYTIPETEKLLDSWLKGKVN